VFKGDELFLFLIAEVFPYTHYSNVMFKGQGQFKQKLNQ